MKHKKESEKELKRIKKRYKAHYIVKTIIRITLIIALLTAIYAQRWTVVFSVSLTLILTFTPEIFKRKFKVVIPIEFELIIIVFVYASLFLGEVYSFYERFWWWDVLLHTGSAIVFGFIGFIIMYILDKSSKIKANPILIAMFSFCFAITIGVLWEIFEFGMDQAIGLNMQKSGLIDTMWDLIVDAIGAIIASISGFFYLKNRNIFIFSKTMKKIEFENPMYFR